jgi:hypothetical protein
VPASVRIALYWGTNVGRHIYWAFMYLSSEDISDQIDQMKKLFKLWILYWDRNSDELLARQKSDALSGSQHTLFKRLRIIYYLLSMST